MVIKKTASPQLPPMHPGLAQKLREAEEAEARGRTPRLHDGPQRILRPSLETQSPARVDQARTIGLVEPAYRAGADGRLAIAEQPVFRGGADLDAIWDQLSESEKVRAGATERFRLEMEALLGIAPGSAGLPHQIGGRLDARNLRRAEENVLAELLRWSALFAPEVGDLVRRFAQETRELCDACLKQRLLEGVDAPTLFEMLRDLVRKLVYQELCSRRRGMGDRGVRRIMGGIDMGELLATQLRRLPDFTARHRLLLRIIRVHQDLGFTAYAARASFRGGKLHRAYGARIFTDETNRYRPLLTQGELELVRAAVGSHSAAELPFASERLLAIVRVLDHLAPFAPLHVYQHFAKLPDAAVYLDDLLTRARAGDGAGFVAAKAALGTLLEQCDLHPRLREDLLAAFRPFERQAELIELGALAGEVRELRFDGRPPGAVKATLAADAFALRYQALFETGQEQVLRLARDTGVASADLRAGRPLRFAMPGLGALEVVPPAPTA